MVPQPCVALIMCFPISEEIDALAKEGGFLRGTLVLLVRLPARRPRWVHSLRVYGWQRAKPTEPLDVTSDRLSPTGGLLGFAADDAKLAVAVDSGSSTAPPASLFYLKQTIGNACGTIAILHSVCNNSPSPVPASAWCGDGLRWLGLGLGPNPNPALCLRVPLGVAMACDARLGSQNYGYLCTCERDNARSAQ
jgi:hypothetical protein